MLGVGCADADRPGAPHTLHPTSYTQHPTPYTLHLTPYTLHPTPYILHPTPYILHLHPTHCSSSPDCWATPRCRSIRSGPYYRVGGPSRGGLTSNTTSNALLGPRPDADRPGLRPSPNTKCAAAFRAAHFVHPTPYPTPYPLLPVFARCLALPLLPPRGASGVKWSCNVGPRPDADRPGAPHTLHPTPDTLHTTHYTLHTTHYTRHPAPHT